jgi:hypothetical protein
MPADIRDKATMQDQLASRGKVIRRVMLLSCRKGD